MPRGYRRDKIPVYITIKARIRVRVLARREQISFSQVLERALLDWPKYIAVDKELDKLSPDQQLALLAAGEGGTPFGGFFGAGGMPKGPLFGNGSDEDEEDNY